MTSNIAHLALNKDPVVADPFALQLALVTNNRYILVCESKADNLVIQQEIRTENHVVALSYNKYCICYALPNAYFVHNILENKTLSLFPYDSQAIRPIIINTDAVSKFSLEIILEKLGLKGNQFPISLIIGINNFRKNFW